MTARIVATRIVVARIVVSRIVAVRRACEACFCATLVRSALLSAAFVSPLVAQSLRGTLLRPDSTPAAGVIVVASLRARDSVLVLAITNGNGRYAMNVPVGTLRLRALRIGHQPVLLGQFTMAAGEIRDTRTVLPDDPIVLMAVTTSATTACRQSGDEGANVATVFEEARKALLSTTLTSSDGAPLARVSEYSEARAQGARDLAPLRREFKEGASLKPFQSLPPDSLAKIGYRQSDASGATYWAPDAEVLLSESFAATHCMSLVVGTGDEESWIGLTFRPPVTKRRFVDVSGTLWVDGATNELRRLDFRYEGLPSDERRLGSGGRVEFTRLASGTWFVSKWEIRMPLFAPPVGSRQPAIVLVKGGEVWRMRRGNDLLFTNGLEEPVAAERVATTPAKDAGQAAVAASRVSCEPAQGETAGNTLRGTVRDEHGAALADALVMVEWQENHRLLRNEIKWSTRRLTTRSLEDGTFAVCGIPAEQLLEVTAMFGSRESLKVAVRITKETTQAYVDLRIGVGTGHRGGREKQGERG